VSNASQNLPYRFEESDAVVEVQIPYIRFDDIRERSKAVHALSFKDTDLVAFHGNETLLLVEFKAPESILDKKGWNELVEKVSLKFLHTMLVLCAAWLKHHSPPVCSMLKIEPNFLQQSRRFKRLLFILLITSYYERSDNRPDELTQLQVLLRQHQDIRFIASLFGASSDDILVVGLGELDRYGIKTSFKKIS